MYISSLFQKNGEMLIFNKYRGIFIVKTAPDEAGAAFM